MKRILLFVVCAAMFWAGIAVAGDFKPHQLTVEERNSDFMQLVNEIKSQYGPKEYKKEHLGIDVDELAEKYWPMMKDAADNGEFYSLITKFIAEFRDGHFRSEIPTDIRAYLPFDVNLVQGKILIEAIDREQLPIEQFPFERGDELISMNGKPVEDITAELEEYVQFANPIAVKNFATYWLTFRPGAKVPVPSGHVSVTLRSQVSQQVKTVALEWIVKGTPFDENLSKSMSIETTRESGYDPTDLSIFDVIKDYRPNIEKSYHSNGITRIAIPENATILMEEPFTAYYYPTSKGNLGYIRIPDYSPRDEDKDGKPDFEKWFNYYTWALTLLEKKTIGLIIDQDHNGGGNVEYFEDIVSLFMTRSFDPLHFRFRASKRNVLNYKSWLDEQQRPYTLAYDSQMELYQLLMDSFSKGLYLTPLTSFRGSQKIPPKNVYTKPVIILIDYFAGSGGDAFPAMMQGLGRAKLLGTTTAGAGGNIIPMEPLFYSQIRFKMTQSLFYRPDGVAVENTGAKPDIPYEITVEDFMDGYKDYQKFYTNELLKMID